MGIKVIFKTLWDKRKVLRLPLISVLISLALVLILKDTPASVIVGADNFDARHLYYSANADRSSGPLCDDVIIYDPFQKTIVSDTRVRLADELTFISECKPKVIVFDHILPNESYTDSDSILVNAIRQCLDRNISFIVPRVRITNDEVLTNFFDSPHYSLDLIPGDFYVPIDRIEVFDSDELLSHNCSVLWIPELVYRLVQGGAHTEDYYRNRYLNFDASPKFPYYYHNSFSDDNDLSELQKQISGRVVVFSAYSAGDDLHNLEFAIQGVAETEQDRKTTKVSGAELLWYAIRDVLKDNWDKQLHWAWVLIISWALTLIYYLCIHCLFSRIFKKAPNLCNSKLCKSVFSFLAFVAITIIFMPILGCVLMHFHLVLPMAIPAISLVMLNVIDVD